MGRRAFVWWVGVFLLATGVGACGEEEMGAWVDKSFVILKSTSKYAEALSFATMAATRLNVKLDLRDLSSDARIGLTFPKALCEEEWDEFPCYVARGRWDDGVYISVEYSSGYKGFSPGMYIVVMANGYKGDKDVQAALVRARKAFQDAYIKTTSVYMGCMH